MKERKFIFLPTLSLPSLSSLLKVPIFFLSQFVPKIVTSTAIETRSSQSKKIGIDLSIDKSIKISKADLIDIDCIDQLVEIYDTLVSFIDLSSVDFYRFHRFISEDICVHLFIQK